VSCILAAGSDIGFDAMNKSEIRKLPLNIKRKIYNYAFTRLHKDAIINKKVLDLIYKYKAMKYKMVILTAREKSLKNYVLRGQTKSFDYFETQLG